MVGWSGRGVCGGGVRSVRCWRVLVGGLVGCGEVLLVGGGGVVGAWEVVGGGVVGMWCVRQARGVVKASCP